MTFNSKSLLGKIIAVAMTGAVLLPMTSAVQADHRHGWRDHGHRHYEAPRRKGIDPGAAVAAGIIGLAAGALIVGSSNRGYAAPAPAPGYVRPGYAPVYGEPVYEAPGFQPWSPAWYRYCTSKYRSFNPNTGTYTTYNGEQRFCQ